MTHKSQPYGFRLGITKDWRARWFAKKPVQYRAMVREDFLLRDFLENELTQKMVSEIIIKRERDAILIQVTSARPGLIIGREGSGVEDLIKKTKAFAKKNNINENITIKVEEIRHIELDAAVIAESVVEQLKKQMPFRSLMKRTVEKVMSNRSVRGARIMLSGRLGGAEIARSEEIKKGNIPLQTLRADIDYAHKNARLPYGTIGVKVWIYRVEDNK